MVKGKSMSDLIFDLANKSDIPELVRLRIAYIEEDFGSVSEEGRRAMEEQLPDYFERRLGRELNIFVARAGGRLVAAAQLLIIEKPANPNMPNGLIGEVYSVFTEKEYRGRGICTQLMKDLVAFARAKKLSFVDLRATDEGYPVYKKVGFADRTSKYKDMRLNI